jgi:MFS family permease
MDATSSLSAKQEQLPRLGAMIAMLIATASLSLFYRTSNAVIAPELIRDLGLAPHMLGSANSAFFIALMILQLPLGVLFDRIGVRRTVAALSVPMAVGSALHALADSGAMLVAARFLVGLGCAGSFMATVVLVPRWFPRERWSTMLGWIFAVSQLGYFLAGTPLAYVAETVGWRHAFLWLAGVALLVGLGILRFVRDYPPGSETAAAAAHGPGALEGLRQVLRAPGILPLFALFSVAYASMITVAGLWIGPYLRDVHGLDAVARGHVVMAVALTLTLGNLLVGPLDRLMRRPKRLVLILGSIAATALGLLAVVPTLSLSVTIGLLLTMCLASSYGPIVLSQIRSRVPDHLAGRGATTANMAQLTGTSLLPVLTGFIPLYVTGAGPGYATDAYRAMFALLALVLSCGLAVYATLRE